MAEGAPRVIQLARDKLLVPPCTSRSAGYPLGARVACTPAVECRSRWQRRPTMRSLETTLP
ncbi:hypothetical protein ADK75_11220 [Streptomyces virginiae]|uniref:Uncharacterized protein n=1 Tax=Streptomyces virginiae TaxID=1961 RepID=A0A0L8MY86_STRVG|nr:hypothetical protein ADK75_11220 [Streptomyces virginiae]